MKFSFLGYSVTKIMELGLDLKDLAILRYFDDFRESGKMNYAVIEGVKYYWISYKNIEEELPFLGLGKRAIMVRMLKLRNLGILSHYTKKEGGTFSYYSPGEKYLELMYYNNADKTDEYKDRSDYEINVKSEKTAIFEFNSATEKDDNFKDDNFIDEDTINVIKNNKYQSNTDSKSIYPNSFNNGIDNYGISNSTNNSVDNYVNNNSIVNDVFNDSSTPKNILTDSVIYSNKSITSNEDAILNNKEGILNNGQGIHNNGQAIHNYIPLKHEDHKNEDPLYLNNHRGCAEKCPTKINLLNNPTTKLNTVYNNIKNSISSIISYLNLQASVMYKVDNIRTANLIKLRLKEGFTIDDFKTVIDKKVKAWKGTAFEQYLNPITLFGNKFEIYLNQNISNAININNNQNYGNNTSYYKNNNPKNLKFHNFKGRDYDYDYDALEKKLLGWE